MNRVTGTRALRTTDPSYLIRRALDIALAKAMRETSARLPAAAGILVLDVGGRGKPYGSLIAEGLAAPGRTVTHLALDSGDGADVLAAAESLPIADGRADVVVCTQVLEHVLDPAAAVSQMARALKPGGQCVLTTHGTWFYHPDPADYWRWTAAGLRRLFETNGFEVLEVGAVGGTLLALSVLGLNALERAAGEGLAARAARRLVVAPANLILGRLTLPRAAGRGSVPGELAINYLVRAVRRRE